MVMRICVEAHLPTLIHTHAEYEALLDNDDDGWKVFAVVKC